MFRSNTLSYWWLLSTLAIWSIDVICCFQAKLVSPSFFRNFGRSCCAGVSAAQSSGHQKMKEFRLPGGLGLGIISCLSVISFWCLFMAGIACCWYQASPSSMPCRELKMLHIFVWTRFRQGKPYQTCEASAGWTSSRCHYCSYFFAFVPTAWEHWGEQPPTSSQQH